MSIFSRKANTSPTAPSVPPELQAYYAPNRPRTGFRRLAMLVLPLVVLLLLVGVVVGAVFYSKTHRLGDLFRRPLLSQSQGQPKQGNATRQDTKPAPSTNSNQAVTDNQPAPSNQLATPTAPSQSPDTTNTQSATANPSAIPRTGPEANILFVAVVTAAGSATLFHIRQVRRASLSHD